MPAKKCGTCAYYTEQMDPKEAMLLQCSKHKKVVRENAPACEDYKKAPSGS